MFAERALSRIFEPQWDGRLLELWRLLEAERFIRVFAILSVMVLKITKYSFELWNFFFSQQANK